MKLLHKMKSWFSRNKGLSDDIDKQLYNVSRKYKISILPITPNYDIENLYPITDHVELWNIFIVGNDKTYILASVNDPHIVIPNQEKLANKQGNNLLPDELLTLFDSIWSRTLNGRQLQFYMVWNSKLYFINTYPFFNGKKSVIGAILFMRAFEKMPEMRFTTFDGNLIPIRFSSEKQREENISEVEIKKPKVINTNHVYNQKREYLETS